MSQRTASCKGCGCSCRYCNDQGGLHLHVEIENLKQQLIERENHIVTMETNFLKEADKFPNGEMAAISEELLTWQEKYSRLYEAHKRVQKVNQNLEDKLLRIVDKCETEKNALTSEVANLTRRLVDEKFNVAKLQEENERYRNDVNLAIQLLQCKPSNFVSQKYDSLPSDMQQKVRSYVWSKRRVSDGNGNHHSPRPEVRTIKVPIPTFPPTAMVYSVNRAPAITEKDGVSEEKNSPVDIVSAAIMAKVLEERERERSQARHCETCTCPGKAHPHLQRLSKATMTDPPSPLVNNSSSGTNLTIGRGRLARRAPQQPTEDQAPVVAEAILVNIESAEESSEGSSGGSGSGGGGGIKAAVPAPPPTAPHDDLMWFESRTSGGRQCSVRLQAGSTNILLDDAAVPVLYRCAPRVHRSTSTSSESSLEPETRSHHHHHHHQRALVRTETEI